jgi:rfaE bifunctional protein nucleotidyltransferase chain/domain
VRAADKILERDALAVRLDELRAQGARIIFTCGVFDLLHVGHVRYLEFARGLGSLLVVGVNSDASVKGLGKADGRPLVPAAERAEVVAALWCVDYVVIFDELRPNETLLRLRPHVHVKDAAYEGAELPEASAVREIGAQLIFAPHVEGRSTSALVERILHTQR